MIRASILLVVIALSLPVQADEVDGTYQDRPSCDDHGPRNATEELGDPSVFSDGQQIEHASTFIDMSACKLTDDPNLLNQLVVVTNLTNRTWRDLFYVGDSSTQFSNVDGVGDAGVFDNVDGLAFRIDSVGNNRPLIFESIVSDDLFQPGEQWHFIVQDYASPIGPPDSFFSIGFADASLAVIETSAASIVQFVVPEPCSVAMLAMGILGVVMGRRRVARLDNACC